jgi:hypothetical protein
MSNLNQSSLPNLRSKPMESNAIVQMTLSELLAKHTFAPTCFRPMSEYKSAVATWTNNFFSSLPYPTIEIPCDGSLLATLAGDLWVVEKEVKQSEAIIMAYVLVSAVCAELQSRSLIENVGDAQELVALNRSTSIQGKKVVHVDIRQDDPDLSLMIQSVRDIVKLFTTSKIYECINNVLAKTTIFVYYV